jgi:spermidine/putrescine transport system permease protein
MNRRPSWLLSLLSVCLYIFIYAPIVVVLVFSFNKSKYGVRWTGFTTKWYEVLLHNQLALDAAWNTAILAGTSTLSATIIGTLLGYGMSRYSFPGKRFFSSLIYIPVTIPDILMAVSLLLFYGLLRDWLGIFELGLPTMIVSHITFEIAFVTIVINARLAGMDPALEEAARDLGADSLKVFRYVTFPLLLPGVLSGALLAFTISLDDFVVSFFTSGPGSTTLPILIYSSVKRGITPDINALSSLIVLFSVCFVLAMTLLQRERKE